MSQFTMNGEKDLESVAEDVFESGAWTGSEDVLVQVVAAVVSALLARLPVGTWEKQGIELVSACRGIYDAAINGNVL